jgi:ferredoxin
MARKLKITVDKNLCVSNATCIAFAPNAFRLDAQGQSEVADPEGDSEEAIIEAAEGCPVAAITVVDAETGEDLLA